MFHFRLAFALATACLALSALAQDTTKDRTPTLPRSTTAAQLSISLQPHWSAGPRYFAITISFDAGGRRRTPLALPDEWAGADRLYRGIRKLRATSLESRVIDGDAPTRRVVLHPPSGRVSLAYELVDLGDQTFSRSRLYQPQLERDYALFFGYGAWVLPAWHEQQPLDVTIAVEDLPGGWTAASSFGAAAESNTHPSAGPSARRVNWSSRGLQAGLLRHCVFVFGDFRLHRADIEGRPVWIALRGQHRFSDTAFVENTAQLVRAHRAFFKDFDVPHLLIALMPNGITDGASYGGTAVYRAFVMHVSGDFTVPGPGFDFLVGHEHLHSWIPQRFGTMGAPGAKDDPLRYWFSEGFTNWLTHRLLLASGVWTLEDYARALSELSRRYETSGARGRGNVDIAGLFFKDNDVGQLPYQRGELLALHWDAQLAAKGSSLAQVLRELLLPPPPYAVRHPLATERLLNALEAQLGASVRADVERWIERAQPVDYAKPLGGPCLHVSRVAIGGYELGFSDASFGRRTVTGLVVGSAAQRAGLREGEVLKGWSVYGGDTSRDAVLQVERNGRIDEVKYRPVSGKTVDGAQFGVKPGAHDDAACKSWIAIT